MQDGAVNAMADRGRQSKRTGSQDQLSIRRLSTLRVDGWCVASELLAVKGAPPPLERFSRAATAFNVGQQNAHGNTNVR